MNSYRWVTQDVPEARRLFCRTLTEISSSEEAEVAVVIQKRGDPLAVLVPWKAAEEIRRLPTDLRLRRNEP